MHTAKHAASGSGYDTSVAEEINRCMVFEDDQHVLAFRLRQCGSTRRIVLWFGKPIKISSGSDLALEFAACAEGGKMSFVTRLELICASKDTIVLYLLYVGRLDESASRQMTPSNMNSGPDCVARSH